MSAVVQEEVTLEGLEHWLKHQYEHLGWMALSVANSHPEKAYAYAMSLDRLDKAIDGRMTIVSNEQQHQDFAVMKSKLQKLKEFSTKLGISTGLKSTVCAESAAVQAGGAKKKASKKAVKKSSKKASKKSSKKSSKKAVKKASKKAVKKE